MDSVLQLLDELEDVMDSSKAVPFSSKVTVNKEEIYDIISEIRMKLPNELKQSKWVIEERNKIQKGRRNGDYALHAFEYAENLQSLLRGQARLHRETGGHL